MTWQFTLTGLLIGSIVGLTGMGGGSLMTPILVIVFGFKPTYAVGTDIVHGAIFKTFGAIRHRRLGTVHGHLTLWMFLGSGPLSLAGVGVATLIKHHYGDSAQSIESYAVGAALVAGGLGFLAKSFIKRGVKPSDRPFILSRRDKIVAVIIGAVFGFVVGLTSVGSGTFFGLVMVLVYPLTMAKIVGTDIFHAAALLWVAGIGHLVGGNVDLHATAWLLTGSIPGVLKNAVDWVSRPVETNTLRNKPVAVIGASTGMFGAVWAQAELRKVLAALGARVIDREVPVPTADEIVRDREKLESTGTHLLITGLLAELLGEAAPREQRVAA